MGEKWTVLVVESDDELRGEIGAWLADAGMEVVSCPGPLAVSYPCPAERGDPCPTVELSDLVVLDLWLQSDTMMEGIPGWELLLGYLATSKPVVAIAGEGDPMRPFPEDRVAIVSRPPDRESVVAAVRSLFAREVFGEAPPTIRRVVHPARPVRT